MISYALILTFITTNQTEQYIIKDNLSEKACIAQMDGEIKSSEHKSNNQMYKEALSLRDSVEAYKAVKMEEPVVEAFYQCVIE